MKTFALTLIFLFISCTAIASAPPYVIRNNPGGAIYDFIYNYQRLNKSGRRVKILGECASACTLITGLVPKHRICVGPRASLAFHYASISELKPNGEWKQLYDERGRRLFSKSGTQLMWDIYPSYIKAWITKNGGLQDNLTFMRYKDLRKIYRSC